MEERVKKNGIYLSHGKKEWNGGRKKKGNKERGYP
jgi:hypothetical protein